MPRLRYAGLTTRYRKKILYQCVFVVHVMRYYKVVYEEDRKPA